MKNKTVEQHKFHLRTGDTVKVLAGNNRNKTGKVIKVIRDRDRAVVEGVNIRKKHVKPSQTNPQGGITEFEAPIHISNLAVLDPKTGEPTRIGRKLVETGGTVKLERYSKKSGEVIKNG